MTRPPRGRPRLAAINFLVAAVQTGFGPFLTVFLTRAGWSQSDIGLALSIGSIAAMASQLPAGALVDRFHRKSRAAAVATAAIGASALVIVFRPTWNAVIASQVIHAAASAMLGPAIAALTLSVRGPADLGEDFGSNARYAAVGSGIAAVGLGLSQSYFAGPAVIWLTAGLTLPAVAIMLHFRESDRAPVDEAAHAAMLHPRERRRRGPPSWRVVLDRGFLVFFACSALFFLGNAATIVLAGNRLSQQTGASSGVLLSVAIIVPQAIVALLSPWLGRQAKQRGRRPVLLAGFLVQPIRALLFAASVSPYALVAGQALDGISGAVLGLMVPLIAADLTTRIGCLNLTMAAINLGAGLGATFSTALAGPITDRFGYPAAFLALAVAGVAATLLLWLAMPETRPGTPAPGADAEKPRRLAPRQA